MRGKNKKRSLKYLIYLICLVYMSYSLKLYKEIYILQSTYKQYCDLVLDCYSQSMEELDYYYISELKIVDSIYFHFISYFHFLSIYFYFGLSVRSWYEYHKISQNCHSPSHMIMCHTEEYKRFQNNNIIQYVYYISIL